MGQKYIFRVGTLRHIETGRKKKISEREVWDTPVSKTIAYYLGWYFKPRLLGGQLLAKGHRQKKENRAQVTSW